MSYIQAGPYFVRGTFLVVHLLEQIVFWFAQSSKAHIIVAFGEMLPGVGLLRKWC